MSLKNPNGRNGLKAPEVVKLSKREKEVLRHLQSGRTNRQIAEHLNISCNTVKTHVDKIFNKLKVQNRTQAAMKSMRMNFKS